jgi:hypothetical protein
MNEYYVYFYVFQSVSWKNRIITMASGSSGTANQDHAVQVIKKYRTYVEMIAEANIRK